MNLSSMKFSKFGGVLTVHDSHSRRGEILDMEAGADSVLRTISWEEWARHISPFPECFNGGKNFLVSGCESCPQSEGRFQRGHEPRRR